MKRWGIVARKILLPVISLLCIMFLFVSCSEKSNNKSKSNSSSVPSHVGMYTNYNSSILLKADGSFVTTISEGTNTDLVFTGKYTLNGEDISFDNQKMNGDDLGTVLNGKLKDGVISYDGGKPFTKDEEYELKAEDIAPKVEPKSVVSAGNATPSPSAENSSPNPSSNDQN